MTLGNYIIIQGEKAIGASRCMLRTKDLKMGLLFFYTTSLVAKGYLHRYVFSFMYILILSKTIGYTCIPMSHLRFMQNFCMDSIVFGYVCILLV